MQKQYHFQASSKLNPRKMFKKKYDYAVFLLGCRAYCCTQVLNQLPGKPQEQYMRWTKQQNLEQRGLT